MYYRKLIGLTGAGLVAMVLTPCVSLAQSGWSGNIAGEARFFNHDASFAQQEEHYLAASAQPEYYTQLDDESQSLVFTPFLRIDQHDEQRTHFDIRELAWSKISDTWELRIGIRRVFWGVTESQHLVDIINQTDLVENIDGEDKLGQPMINLALIRDWGTLDLFILTGFRERTFPGEEGRYRSQLPVDTDNALYESSDEDKHVDFAARWVRTISDWDIGLSYFYGTNRTPSFLLNTDGDQLLPYYSISRQAGLDLQTFIEDWLLKLELISVETDNNTYTAATTGFEYTIVGLYDSTIDLGLLSEYLFDDRHEKAQTPFEDDLMIGLRLTFNDVQSTEILFGYIKDLDTSGYSVNLEASRRLGDSWKLSLESRSFSNARPNTPSYDLRNDDYFLAELAWYF